MIYACFFPNMILEASKTGLMIWFQQILPALLPFTILSAILIRSNFLHSFSENGSRIALLLTIVCGFIFGFPIGAKLSADFYKCGLLTKQQATALAVITNNFSPMYVCGYVLPTLFPDTDYQLATYILIYFLPLVLISLISFKLTFGKKKKHETIHEYTASSFHLNMETIDNGIISGFETLIRICGYIVLFSIAADILCRIWNHAPFFWNWVLGNLEITNGIYLLSRNTASESLRYIATIQLLSLGGISGFVQTASIFQAAAIGTDKLSIHKYIIGKAALSLLLTLLTVIYVSHFNYY